MCGRAYSPRFMYSWPNVKILVMGGEQAAGVVVQIARKQRQRENKVWSKEEEDKLRKTITERFDAEGSPYYSSARLLDDSVIDPADTRMVIAMSLATCLNTPIPETNFGIFRM